MFTELNICLKTWKFSRVKLTEIIRTKSFSSNLFQLENYNLSVVHVYMCICVCVSNTKKSVSERYSRKLKMFNECLNELTCKIKLAQSISFIKFFETSHLIQRLLIYFKIILSSLSWVLLSCKVKSY